MSTLTLSRTSTSLNVTENRVTLTRAVRSSSLAVGGGIVISGGASGSVAWDDVTGKPATFPPSAHNQAWSTITATPTTLAGYGITDAATAAQGALAGTALQPGAQIPWANVTGKPAFATVATTGAYADLSGRPTLGTAAAAATTDFATAAQGALAGTALQPASIGVTVQGYSAALAGTTASFTTADETKLDGIAAGATANATDAALRDRATHTGTQTASTISDFAAAVAATPAVTANTAKVSNATHTGDVTGATVLTIANDAVTYAKMQNAAANTVLARAAGTSGDIGEVAIGASQLFGRGATGDLAPITLGTNLSMTGATLNAAGGSGSTQVYVQNTDPGMTGPGIWIQTGLAPGGTGFTFWFEDGL